MIILFIKKSDFRRKNKAEYEKEFPMMLLSTGKMMFRNRYQNAQLIYAMFLLMQQKYNLNHGRKLNNKNLNLYQS
jgi:hypothetical protein